MNKWEYVDEINSILEIMQPILQKVGYKETFLGLPLNFNELSYEFIKDAYTWLHKIYKGPFERYREIRKHGSDEYWSKLCAWAKEGDFRELKLLKAAEKHLRESLYGQRPKVLTYRGRNFKVKKDTSEHTG